MNNEQQELLDEAYIKYQNQTMFHTDDLVPLKELDGMYMSTGEKTKVYRQFAPKEFINKCKTDQEFSEKWGLTIEERELSLEERVDIFNTKMKNQGLRTQIAIVGVDENYWKSSLEKTEHNIPTRLITVTYNDQIIESYE
jgi:hypothetical protein